MKYLQSDTKLYPMSPFLLIILIKNITLSFPSTHKQTRSTSGSFCLSSSEENENHKTSIIMIKVIQALSFNNFNKETVSLGDSKNFKTV